MHPHPDREPGAQGRETRRQGLAQALLQVERGEHCAPGMVLLGSRRPKEGEDVVTHHRLEGPPVALHCLLRQGSEGVQRAVVRLARERAPQRGRSHGAAQHRDGLPLTDRCGGVALERRLFVPGVRLWTPLSAARCPLRGGPWDQIVGGLRQRRRGTQRYKDARADCTSGGIRAGFHRPDKAIAIAPPRLDELLRVPTVPDGLARPFDAALQRRLTDELAGPHLRAQFLSGDHVVAMRQQIHEHLEHLAPQRAGGPRPGQGIELGIENTIGKGVAHG